MAEFDVLDQAVVNAIKGHAGDGVDPSDLIRELTKLSGSRREAQLAVQRALDEGQVGLGAEMRVYPGRKIAA